MNSTKNEPGTRWRILAHNHDKKVEVENQGKFDELVVDDWLHVEKMDDNVWWLRVGDVRLFVTIPSADPPIVDLERGFYGPINGATKLLE